MHAAGLVPAAASAAAAALADARWRAAGADAVRRMRRAAAAGAAAGGGGGGGGGGFLSATTFVARPHKMSRTPTPTQPAPEGVSPSSSRHRIKAVSTPPKRNRP